MKENERKYYLILRQLFIDQYDKSLHPIGESVDGECPTAEDLQWDIYAGVLRENGDLVSLFELDPDIKEQGFMLESHELLKTVLQGEFTGYIPLKTFYTPLEARIDKGDITQDWEIVRIQEDSPLKNLQKFLDFKTQENRLSPFEVLSISVEDAADYLMYQDKLVYKHI